MLDADPINPQRLFWELNRYLPDDAIISSDSGSSANWYARDIKMKTTHLASLSGTLATMGPGVPYAIAAKFAYPNRPAIALVGDGAMQMNGMAELITAAKYYDRWADPRLIVLVLNNRDLNQVTWEQRAMEGDPRNPITQSLPDVHYARLREADRPRRRSHRRRPTGSSRRGTRHSRPTARSSSTRSSTRRSRRCRRTSRSSRRSRS